MKSTSKAMIWSVSGLFTFGCAFAWFVRRLGDRHAGYTFILVIIGDTAVILAMAPVIGWKNAMKLFVGFAAAGIPMSFGDVVKGVNLRERYQFKMQETNLKLAVRGTAQDYSGVRDDTKRKGGARSW